MRKLYWLLIILPLLVACEQEQIKVDKTTPYVSFYAPKGYYMKLVQEYDYNFIYADDKVKEDTIWVKIISRAALPSKDMKVSLRAFNDTTDNLLSFLNADSGVHYKSFQDMADKMILHKGQMLDSIPVVLLRDKSLKENGRRLTLRMADSEDRKAADQKADNDDSKMFVVIYISDGYSEPSNWRWYMTQFGRYGKVKHEFMIKDSGQRWDAAFIEEIRQDPYDQIYYLYKFRNDLKDLNQRRAAEGKGPLAEADGSLVEF